MEDLAKLAGLSKITVSRALRHSPLVKPETRRKVQKLAQEQGYRFNVSARNLRLRRSYSVAVVVQVRLHHSDTEADDYPSELLAGVMQACAAAGYSVILTTRQLIDTPPVKGADGLILLGQGQRSQAVRFLQQTHIPLVVWGAPEPGGSYPVIGSDNRMGGASAAERFIVQGRKKLIFLGDVGHPEVQDRYAGFAETVGAHASVRVICPVAFSDKAGFDIMSEFLQTAGVEVDGVFAASDFLAMGAIRALAGNNLRVPQEVSVIGYDDSPGAVNFVPSLTSVRQDLRDGGRLLAKKMLDLIDGGVAQSEMLPIRLVVRQS